jgi:hypothetical protein
MYSFVLHAHQKIDRVAYRQLSELTQSPLPFSVKQILHFEGRRGPDATRLKKGGGEAPWHFYTPDCDNASFLNVLRQHHARLTKELTEGNVERAAFEAAWLAHALVDGLTPAHHFPYEHELLALRREEKATRETVGSHFIVKGKNSRETVKRSFQLIGPKGLLTTHTTFEAGAAMILLPLKLAHNMPSKEDTVLARSSIVDCFEKYVREVGGLHMYERFYKRGWTQSLARDVRVELAPCMIRIVTLAWYSALLDAGVIKALPS